MLKFMFNAAIILHFTGAAVSRHNYWHANALNGMPHLNVLRFELLTMESCMEICGDAMNGV